MIHVFGLGECGSRIALDLFGQLYPNATIEENTPQSTLRRCLAALGNAFGKVSHATDLTVGFQLGAISISLKPHIFIGDLNKGNTNYRRYLAAQRIREMSRTGGAEIDRSKCKSILEDEGLLDERIQFDTLYDLVIQKQGGEQLITLLRFTGGINSPDDASFDLSTGMAGEGAGGNQIYSELAAQKFAIHNGLKTMNGAKSILIGIVSIGGGTGAGSATQIFRELASDGYAYTLAVAVTPTWDDSEQKARAGRYIAKYLRMDNGKKPRGLLLISNQAASIAMRKAEGKKGIDQGSSLAAVNEFSLNCLKAILLLRATTLRTIEGKQLDFMDLSTWIRGMFAMGYASQSIGVNEEVDLWPHVVRAISPLTISDDPQMHHDSQGLFLEGLSVCVSDEQDPYKAEVEITEIRDAMLSAASSLAGASSTSEREAAAKALQSIGDSTAIYGTIKRCTFLIFIPNSVRIANTPGVKDRLRSFFQALTGNPSFDLSFNVYSIEGLNQIELVAFPQECLINEAVRHVAEFAGKGFANESNLEQLSAANELIDETWNQLLKVFRKELSGVGADNQPCDDAVNKIIERLAKFEQLFEEREELYKRVNASESEAQALRLAATDLLPVIQQFRLQARTLPLFNTTPTTKFSRGKPQVADK